MLELSDTFIKYLFFFEVCSFSLLSFFTFLYKRFSKQSKKIVNNFSLSELSFVDLKKGYATKMPISEGYLMCLMIFNSLLSIISITNLSYIWLPVIFVSFSILLMSSYRRIIFYEDYFTVKYLHKKNDLFYYANLHKVRVKHGYKEAFIIHIIFKDSLLKEKKIDFRPAYWYRDRDLISIILANKVNGRTETEVLNNLNENDF